MKRIVSLILSMALLFSLVIVPSYAANEPSVEITASKTQFQQSNTAQVITISVVLKNPDPAQNDIAGMEFALESKDAKLVLADTATSVTNAFSNASYNSGTFAAMNMDASFNAVPLSGTEVTIITIEATLEANAPVGEYVIATEDLVLANTDSDSIYENNASVTITVVEPPISSIAVTGLDAPAKGVAPDKNVVLDPADGITADVKWLAGTTPFTGDKFAANTVYTAQVTLTAAGGKNFANNVSVDGFNVESNNGTTLVLSKVFGATAAKAVTAIDIIESSVNVDGYVEGQTFDTTGLKIKVTYDEGDPEELTSGFEITGSTTLSRGVNTFTVSYGGQTDTLTVNAAERVVDYITVSGGKVNYVIGESADWSTLVVTAFYNDGGNAAVTPETITTLNTSAAGTQEITVTYGGKSATFEVTIEKKTLTAADFEVTLPTDAVYKNDTFAATVTAKDANIGAVTVKYNGETAAPKNAGTYAVTIDVVESDTYKAATGLSVGSFDIAKASATITTAKDSVSVKMQKTVDLAAEISNNGALTYSSQNVSIATVDTNGIVTGVQPGTTTVTVSYQGDENYLPTYKDVSVTVTELEPQEVSFVTADQTKTYGDPAFTVSATNATVGGGAITYSSSNTNVITVDGNTVTIVGAGTAKVIATAAPITGFAATTVELNVTVNKAASPALTVTGADEVAYAETIELGVEGGSAEASAVTYTVVSGDATIEGNKLTANGVGEIKVKATKAETANYLAVESAEKTITAKKNETYQTEDKTSENKTGEAVEIADVIPADIWEEVKTKLNEVAVVVKMVQNAVEEVLTEDAMKKIFLNGEVKIEEGKLVFELLPAATVGDYIIEVSVPETSLAGNFVATVELNVTKANSGYDRPNRPAAVPAEVKDVIGLINDLPSAKKVTLDDEELIEDARKAYEKLSKANQAKVSNYADLVAAEEALEALKEAAAEVVENPFVDVDEDAYYADAVLWAIENNITAGTSIDTFSPEAVCTRAQVVTFLWRAAGCPAPLTSDMPFADVEAGAYYAAAVQWAVENNITAGTAFDAFDPNGECTRGQIVTFLWRAQGNPAAAAVGGFEDVEDGAYYDAPVVWAVANGITNGTSATTFSPAADCTRAQVVTFLYRCLAE